MSEISTIRIIVDSLLFMLILLVQLIIYPVFHNISSDIFPNGIIAICKKYP